MDQQSPDDLRLVRRLTPTQGYINWLLDLSRDYARAATQCRKDAETARDFRIKAEQLQEFLWAVRDEDEIWMAVRRSGHPELPDGVMYFAIVRSGTVIAKRHAGAIRPPEAI